MAHLSSGRVNLAQMREGIRRQLLRCLDKCPGSKAIIWDDKLTGPVGLIAEYSLLKEHDVGKMFPLVRGKLPSCEEHNIIFLVRPKLETMDIIAENVKGYGKNHSKEFHIFFVPSKSNLCELSLEKSGVYGSFSVIDEFDLSLIPFDNDIMSLEQEKAFYECYVENDLTSMLYVANSLMTIQALFGTIPKIYGKGQLAKHVTDIILRKRREMADNECQITPLIDNLVLIDRNIDLLTPLLTQLTYEGLIDESLKIENTCCQLPAPKDEPKNKQQPEGSQKAKPKKVILNSGENLYAEIRDMNFSAVGPVLSREAKRITAEYEEHRAAKTVGEMKEFVHKLPHIQAAKQSLAQHTSIAELLKEHTDSDDFRESLRVEQEFFHGIDTDKAHPYIEQCIGVKEPIQKVLRLVCLQCFVNNGFKVKLFDYYRREIIQTYGFEHLLTLNNLETVGMLRSTMQQRNYNLLRKSLKLVVEDVQETQPNDIAYVHSGYAPLSVRLAQFLERQSGWRGLEEILKQLPGPTVEEKQNIPAALLKKNTGGQSNADGPPRVTLVYFLGGCTYSEISALRFLAQQENASTDYVIATTNIINGTSLVESAIEQMDKIPVNNG